MNQKALTLRIFGFVASILLTLGSYFLVLYRDIFHLQTEIAIIIILAFATLQLLFQFLFFLDLWREKGPKWNIGTFLSTLVLVILIIMFSIWVMHALNYNMMQQ